MSNDVIEQVRRYLDHAVEADEPVLAPAGDRRWDRRGPVLAALTAVLVLAVAIPALILGSGSQPSGDPALPEPLEVGVDHVWPEDGFEGSPEEIAAEFARRALGWTDFETVDSEPSASPAGPVWTTIRRPGLESFEVLSIPTGGGRRVLVQVGSAVITTGPSETGTGQRIGVPSVPGAESAVLHVRFVDPDRVEVYLADHDDLARGWFDVAEESPIGGVVVVYRDRAGEALTAAGGHYGPLDVLPDPSDEVTYTTYFRDGNTWVESDCPNTDHALTGNPDGLPHISSTTDREAIQAWLGEPENARIVPRNGEVWERDSDGRVVVTQVQDWMIEVTIDDPAKCPGLPTSTNGVPVVYRIAGE